MGLPDNCNFDKVTAVQARYGLDAVSQYNTIASRTAKTEEKKSDVTTDDDLDTIQITVGVMTGKQPNSGSSKITITNNKSFQCSRIPRRVILEFFALKWRHWVGR